MKIANNMIQRPEGYENEKRDCTVRALSLAANLPYEEVHQAFAKMGRKNKRGVPSKKIIHGVGRILGIEIKYVRRTGSIARFLRDFPTGRYYCTRRGHAFAVIDGIMHDQDNTKQLINMAYSVSQRSLL